MAKAKVVYINVRKIGRLQRVHLHRGNLSSLRGYERKVMSYEEY